MERFLRYRTSAAAMGRTRLEAGQGGGGVQARRPYSRRSRPVARHRHLSVLRQAGFPVACWGRHDAELFLFGLMWQRVHGSKARDYSCSVQSPRGVRSMLVLRVLDTHEIGNVPKMPAVPGVSGACDRVRSGLAPPETPLTTPPRPTLPTASATCGYLPPASARRCTALPDGQ